VVAVSLKKKRGAAATKQSIRMDCRASFAGSQ